jgi:hypothetical protein
MTTRVLEIVAIQPPFSIGEDEKKRALVSCNFYAKTADTVIEFCECVAKMIQDAGYGNLGTDVFIGPHARMPDGNGPYVTITATGGFVTDKTHNGDKYPRPSFQVMTRATSYRIAKDRAHAIFLLLDNQHNVTVTP